MNLSFTIKAGPGNTSTQVTHLGVSRDSRGCKGYDYTSPL